MDVVIPGHSVRTFASAIQCLSKIGKDLYIDFDPMDGLCLRALNDAKSAFCVVEFSPNFFERCTTPTVSGIKRTASALSSQGDRFSCRVPMRALAPVVRPRKGVLTLRVTSEGDAKDSHSALQLAFEFHVEVSDTAAGRPTLCKVLHKMGVAEVDNIAAVAPKEDCSELVAAPKVWSKWLEPIKRTAEACLIFHQGADTVVATSFNSTDTASMASSKNSLKTETSISLEDLQDYDFRDQRMVPSQPEADPITGLPPPCPMPNNVNQEVILVFGMKEAKALLQFCCQNAAASNSYDDFHEHSDNNHRTPWSVGVSFHWAGKPMIWESKSAHHQGVSIELVLATLSHNILKDLPMMQQRERTQRQQERQQERRRSSSQ